MDEYRRLLAVSATRDDVFRWVAAIENLPCWVPSVREAQTEDGRRMQLRGEFNGSEYELTGTVEIDEKARRVRWQTYGSNRFEGVLEVRAGDTVGSFSELALTVSADSPLSERAWATQPPTLGEDAIQDVLGMALLAIRDHVERRGEPGYEPPAAV